MALFGKSMIFNVVLILLILGFSFCRKNKSNGRSHQKRYKIAKRTYNKINSIYKDKKESGWLILYLRNLDPFVFEELILYSFKKKKIKVVRNKRYTGDGGIDGKIVLNGKTILIQAKRYSDWINSEHIVEFASVCRRLNTTGLFIHTGKTGELSKSLFLKYQDCITCISGNKLFDLFIRTKNFNFLG